MNPYAPPKVSDGPPRSIEIDPGDALEIRSRISSLNRRSFVLGAPGFVLQFMGNAMDEPVLTWLGFALLVAGCAQYAKMRGRHPAFGLLGLLSCVGLLILALLPKKCLYCETSHSFRGRSCTSCGAPLGS